MSDASREPTTVPCRYLRRQRNAYAFALDALVQAVLTDLHTMDIPQNVRRVALECERILTLGGFDSPYRKIRGLNSAELERRRADFLARQLAAAYAALEGPVGGSAQGPEDVDAMAGGVDHYAELRGHHDAG